MVHEFGHILAAWLSGGSVHDVVLFSLRPHVQIDGFASAGEEAFRAVGGSLCSLVGSFAVLLLAPRRSIGWHLLRDTGIAFGCVELLGWSLSSLFSSASEAYPDDAQRFLAVSGADPHIVVTVCAVIAFSGFLLLRRRAPALAAAPVELRAKAAVSGSFSNR